MNDAQIARMVAWKLTGQMSCAKCKYLYFHDRGYSNYTVEETEVNCALDRNSNLLHAPHVPYDWMVGNEDNWPMTNASRCEMYEETTDPVHFDVDGDTKIADFNTDADAAAAISKHSGRS